MPDKRPDPRYRPGGTTDYYEGMLPFYEHTFGDPRQQQPAKQVTEGLLDAPAPKPSMMDRVKAGAGKVKDTAKKLQDAVGVTDRGLRTATTAAQLISGGGALAGLAKELRPNKKQAAPKGRASAAYPSHPAFPDGLLNAGIGSGYAIGSSSADIPASP